MKIAVLGTGYVGLVAGAGFSDFGNDVICADVDAARVARLLRGEVPIHEPGLDALIARNTKNRRLSFTTDVEAAVRGAEVVIIAVGTPSAADGSADLTYVNAAAESIGRALSGYTVVLIKSTVPVGTGARVRELIAAEAKQPFSVVSNPEFLKEGDAVNDFLKPDRVLLGPTDPGDDRARALLRGLYAPFVRTNDRLHFMDSRSAELAKYAANALLATRISFMNELSGLAEKVGADVESVRRALGSDPRIGPKFLFPGAGFGGSCFPKDLRSLLHEAKRHEAPLAIVQAVQDANARQKRILADKLERHFGSLAGKVVAVWGLAFKPATDDIREAPALELIDRLLAAGARVSAHDPAAMENVRSVYGGKITLAPGMYEALEGADALVLVTEWHEFRRPDFARVKGLLRQAVVVDGRNVWDPAELRAAGFTYYGIGRP